MAVLTGIFGKPARNRCLAVGLGLFCVTIAGCGDASADGDEEIDLSALHPNAEMAISPGGSYEISFSPKFDNLDISVADTPEGITASVEPDTDDDQQILFVEVDVSTEVRGQVNIELEVDNEGNLSTVSWPFEVED